MKEFGIYTLENWIYIFVDIDTVLKGFKINWIDKGHMSNTSINEFLETHLESFSKINIIYMQTDDVLRCGQDLAYLGQVDDKLQDQLYNKYSKLMAKF